MLPIPDLDGPSVAFGDIKHMPKYETIPAEFKRHNGNDYVKAVSSWFFSGAKKVENGIEVDGMTFKARDGVDPEKAIRAIKAVLGSWEPKHEVKEAACGYMLSLRRSESSQEHESWSLLSHRRMAAVRNDQGRPSDTRKVQRTSIGEKMTQELVAVKVGPADLVIEIRGVPHLIFRRADLSAVESWIRNVGSIAPYYFIEFMTRNGPVTTDYNDRSLWEEILKKLAAARPFDEMQGEALR